MRSQNTLILLALLVSFCFSLKNTVFLEEDYSTGFVPLDDDSSMFYLHFNSRSNPKTDPLVIWLQGDLNKTLFFNVLNGNGPFRFDSSFNLISNMHSWNSHANLLYVE